MNLLALAQHFANLDLKHTSKMSKHTYYFKHDLNAHEDEKILDLRMEHGMEGYGIYWLLIELLASSTDYAMGFNPKRIAFSNSASEQVVKSVIEDFDLFVVGDGIFTSKSLRDRMMRLDEIKNKRAEAGRKGGKSKANAKQLLSKREAIAKQKQAEERREEKRKEEKTHKGSSLKENKASTAIEASADSGKLDEALELRSSQQAATETQPSWLGWEDQSCMPLRGAPAIGAVIFNPKTGAQIEYEGT